MIDDLEGTIRDLLERHEHAREGSAEQRFLRRQLISLRLTYEEAGGIIEDFSAGDWFCGPEDYQLVGIDVTSADRARKPSNRFVGFRREPSAPSISTSGPDCMSVAGNTFSAPRSMAPALGLKVGHATAARDTIMNEVKELADLLRGDGEVTMEELTKLGEIHELVSGVCGADPGDPL